MSSVASSARRNVRVLLLAAGLSFIIVSLALNRDRVIRATTGVVGRLSAESTSTLSREVRNAYVDSIMNASANHLPRLECPDTDLGRYEYLKDYGKEADPWAVQYYFALNLRQALQVLPRLLGSVVDVVRFLGPERCLLSIVEGNSDDGTPEILDALLGSLEDLNTTYRITHTSVDPLTHPSGRIPTLAALRQMALSYIEPRNPQVFPTNPTSTILFLNDVAICPEDILELLHQRIALNATVTCAMDWTYVGRDPTFYDVWVARTIAGDSFFEIPGDGNWDSAWNLFWNEPGTQARYNDRKPFQVFSCWNGAVAIAAEPVVKDEVRFRGPREEEGECMQGEPQLFCKDLWWKGYGRIAVVPGVSLEYSDDRGRQIKKARGYTSRWRSDEGIEWRTEPPEKVKCMPSYENQYWEAWNKSQPGVGYGKIAREN